MSQQQWGHGYWTGYRVAQRLHGQSAPKCEACGEVERHAEGCPVARLAWHRRRRDAPLQIYCAGKIAPGDWRHTLLERQLRHQCSDPDEFAQWPIMERAIFGRHHYVGPYFISDDHGCFHGDGTHGAGVVSDVCRRCKDLQDRLIGDPHGCRRCGEPWPTWVDDGREDDPPVPSFCIGASGPQVRRHQVLEHCRQAVARCDVVFAWLEDVTAYGTLVELGWADALGKTIWVASPHWWRDLWFAYTTAHDLRIGLDPGPVEALRQFIDTYVISED